MKHRSGREFQHLTRVDDALRLFFGEIAAARVKEVESVQVQDALGRVLARQVTAKRSLPANDVAVVDGYAIRSVDVQGASSSNPVVLRLVGESRLGERSRLRIQKGQAALVATGSRIPKGGTAVVMIEHVQRRGIRLEFRAPVDPHQGMTRKGEDVKPGSLVLDKGSRLRPEDLGVLKALGLRTIQVVRRVRVGVLSTGDELVETFRTRNDVKIVDLNRPILAAKLQELGAEALDLGIAKDDERAIKAALKTGLARTDLLVVTAGSSVGKRDLVPECIDSLGRPGMLVHGVAMRPAMPTGLAVVSGKPIVSLPGFPVSAMVAFRIFVRPLLAKLIGAPESFDPTLYAILTETISGTPGFRTFVRVMVKLVGGKYVATPLKAQRSSLLTSMVKANGIVAIPESTRSIEAGTEVSVALTGDLLT
jgi:molybdopterin molybdotransferase